MTYVLCFFILRLRLRPTAKGRSLSGPNIRLRPKVKIAPTVQHCETPQPLLSYVGQNLKQVSVGACPPQLSSSSTPIVSQRE